MPTKSSFNSWTVLILHDTNNFNTWKIYLTYRDQESLLTVRAAASNFMTPEKISPIVIVTKF